MKITTAIVVAITLLTGFSNSLCAEEEKSPAIKLIEMMDFTKTAKAGATASFAPFLEKLKAKGVPEAGLKEVSEAAERFFSKTFDNPKIVAEIATVYENSYTKEEMAQLLEFYKTPLGKKTLETMPQIMQQSAIIGQKFAMEHQAKFQAEMQEIMAKYTPAP